MAKTKYIAGIAKDGQFHKFGIPLEQFKDVEVEVDENVGTPSATGKVKAGKLFLSFKNLKANGISDIVQTKMSDDDGGINTWTIYEDNGNTIDISLRNGNTASGTESEAITNWEIEQLLT